MDNDEFAEALFYWWVKVVKYFNGNQWAYKPKDGKRKLPHQKQEEHYVRLGSVNVKPFVYRGETPVFDVKLGMIPLKFEHRMELNHGPFPEQDDAIEHLSSIGETIKNALKQTSTHWYRRFVELEAGMKVLGYYA